MNNKGRIIVVLFSPTFLEGLGEESSYSRPPPKTPHIHSFMHKSNTKFLHRSFSGSSALEFQISVESAPCKKLWGGSNINDKPDL